MKQGWEYKKLGEVGTFIRGKNIQKTDFVEKGLPCIHYGQLHTVFGVSTDKHLSNIPQELYEQSIIASKNDVLLALTSEDVEGSCRSTAWLGNYDVAVSSDAAVYKHSMNPKFVTYYLRSNSFFIEKSKYARGFKVTHIKTSDIAKIPIPLPPKSTQLAIVSELDKINELIRLKKEQLKDYDNLAQSIFYEMFGDPVENEMGWEVKKLGEVCTDIKYGTSKPACENGRYKYLRMCNLTDDGFLDLSNLKTIDIADDEIEKCIVRYGDILFNRTNSIELVGKTCMFDKKEPMVIAGYIIRVRLNEALLPIVLAKMFNLTSIKKVLRSMAKGAVNQANINSKELASIKVPLPPLPLQQLFAQRIEQIERQKAEVQKTITDLETLLASRMQYWFE